MDTTTPAILARLTSSDDTAAYLFSHLKLQNNLSSILSAFKSLYPGVFLAYSFKTNYLKDICLTMLDRGHFAEVVSPAEYDYALSLGFPHNRIVYNGVIPDSLMKFRLASIGGCVNIDNLGEFYEIAAIAHEQNTPIKLGVRVNIDVGANYVSRFGVDVQSDEFREIMRSFEYDALVSFTGFHVHIGSTRQLSFWKTKIEKMIDLAKEWGASYIDLGGGMFGEMPPELAKQFDGYVGDFNDYASVVASKMAAAFPDNRVNLILEPGTALVGNTMKVAAKVTNIKRVRGKTFITVGCCSNHIGMLCECRDIPAHIYRNPEIPDERIHVEDAIIVGNTCLEFDYIKKGFTGSLLPGDIIFFDNCGAYSISASRQFIIPRLPVYNEYNGDLLLRGESSVDMLGKYLFC